jgi:hypothetical protein
MAVRVTVQPPTLSSTASFGSGSWYTTERILQEPYHSRPFDVEAVVVLLFVRSGETTPLFNHGRSSYGASHRRFQVLQASVQVAGILLKDPARAIPSRPFVVMLRRSLCCFREVRRNYTTLQPWPFELQCKPPTLGTCKLRFR